MKTLLLTHPLPAAGFAQAIHAVDASVPLLEYQPALHDSDLADVEAVLGWRFPEGVAARLPKLRWVCSIGAGVDKLLPPELASGVAVSPVVPTTTIGPAPAPVIVTRGSSGTGKNVQK